MTDLYAGLEPAFRDKLPSLELRCAAARVLLLLDFGLRDPITQCIFYRQSHPSDVVAAKRAHLVAAGAPFLVACFDKAGPQKQGDWKTNAVGGEGWHQWGQAGDYAWIVDGNKVDWSTTDGGANNGYHVLAREAEAIGLTSGMAFGDNDHVQMSKFSSPMAAGLTYPQIDAAMKAKFPDLLA